MALFTNELTNLLELKYPLIVAPMAGGPSTPELVVAASEGGALGSFGAAYSTPQAITDVCKTIRAKTQKPFALNLFLPSKPIKISDESLRLAILETQIFRNELSLPPPDLKAPFEEDFEQQFEAVLRARPKVFSFVFGLLSKDHIRAARNEKIILVGTATSPEEALQLSETGIDAIVAQGIEAGGHRGIFDSQASDPCIQTLDLLKQIKVKIKTPLIAAGGIMSNEDIKMMLNAGAQAVQMGTAFLAVKEAGTSAPYRKKLLESSERKTRTTRAFSGRFARGIENRFMNEMDRKPEAILAFPAQNKFTRDIRNASLTKGTPDFLSLWSGSGRGALWTGSAADLIQNLLKLVP